jgi:CRP-like cAMP-binding protein
MGEIGAHRMPYDERDEDTGKFTNAYSYQEFVDSLESLSGQASTQDIADEVGCAYRTAYQKLVELEEQNKITSKKVANARLWMLPSE